MSLPSITARSSSEIAEPRRKGSEASVDATYLRRRQRPSSMGLLMFMVVAIGASIGLIPVSPAALAAGSCVALQHQGGLGSLLMVVVSQNRPAWAETTASQPTSQDDVEGGSTPPTDGETRGGPDAGNRAAESAPTSTSDGEQTDTQSDTSSQAPLIDRTGPHPPLFRAPIAGSDTGHLWYLEPYQVTTRDETQTLYRIVHQGPNTPHEVSLAATLIPNMPQAMVAVNHTLYLIFAPQTNGDADEAAATVAGDASAEAGKPVAPSQSSGRRTVTSVRAVWNDVARLWMFVPRGRTNILDSLPGGGDLISAIPGPRGPMVLLHVPPGVEDADSDSDGNEKRRSPTPLPDEAPPAPSANGDPAADNASSAFAMSAAGLQLYYLELNRWVRVPLPTDLPDAPSVYRLLSGPEPMLAAQTIPDSNPAALLLFEDDATGGAEASDPVPSHGSELTAFRAWRIEATGLSDVVDQARAVAELPGMRADAESSRRRARTSPTARPTDSLSPNSNVTDDDGQSKHTSSVWTDAQTVHGLDRWLWEIRDSAAVMGQTLLATEQQRQPENITLHMVREDKVHRIGTVSQVGAA
ncbi:MAG: hypothetical protein ACOC0P_05850, partial [Planctomycetota bacterium]